MPNKLTDAQIRDLYLGLANHYRHCQATTTDSLKIYNQLYYNLWHTLNDDGAPLTHLEADEKLKAYKVLNTFFYASPLYNPRQASSVFLMAGQPLPPAVVIIDKTPRYHCHHDNFFLNVMLFDSLSRAPRPSYGPVDAGVTHTHGQSSQGSKKEEDQAKAMLLLVAVSVAIAASALIALFYLIRQMLNSAERFYYNEGWMQASLSMLSMTVSGIATVMLAQSLFLSPLIGLAFVAGLSNPVGLAVLGVIAIGIVGAAVGCLITNKLQTMYVKNTSEDALNPNDPYRFALTDAEARELEKKSIDPIKVKCAIVALYAQISKLPDQSFCASLFSRRTKEVQACLDNIRQLRSGRAFNIKVGDMSFNLYKELEQVLPSQEIRHHARPAVMPTSAGVTESSLRGGESALLLKQSSPLLFAAALSSIPSAPPGFQLPLNDDVDDPSAVAFGSN